MPNALPPGMTGFDFFEPPAPTTQESARVRVERKLHETPQMLDSTRMLKTSLVDRIWWFRKSRAWFVDAGDVDKAAAIKLGKRVQKALKGRRTLTSDIPHMHGLDLYVGYGADYVQLPPLIASAGVVAVLDDVAETLERLGRRSLAAVVDAAANELLEQRDDMLDWTGFDDVMKRADEVADRIYEERIEPMDTTELLSERP